MEERMQKYVFNFFKIVTYRWKSPTPDWTTPTELWRGWVSKNGMVLWPKSSWIDVLVSVTNFVPPSPVLKTSCLSSIPDQKSSNLITFSSLYKLIREN